MSNQDFDIRKQSTDCMKESLTKDESLPRQSIRPCENSNMFKGFFSWEGRYNRTQYIIAILIAVVIYAIVGLGGGFLLGILYAQTEINMTRLILYAFASALIPACIIAVAGIKRAHDCEKPWYWALLVILPFFWLNLFTLAIGIVSFVFLIKDKSVENVKEYGGTAAESYDLKQDHLEGRQPDFN